MRITGSSVVPVLLYILVNLTFPLFSTAGETPKGQVVEIRDGRLEKLVNSVWKQIVKGDPVSLGDRLRTGKSGVAVVEIPNVGRFVLGPGSEIELGREGKEFKSNMPRGAVWLDARFPKGTRGSITTTLASAGIRGTKFSVLYRNGTADLCICTCEGEVEALLKNGKTVPVPKGKFILARADGAPDERAEPALFILEGNYAGSDFCFTCHVKGGKGKLISSRQ